MINEIKSLNEKLGNILSEFQDNFSPDSEAVIPILSFLPKIRQSELQNKIIAFRTKLKLEFENSNEKKRNELLKCYKESTNLHPFIPVNIDDIKSTSTSVNLIFEQALFAILIEDLNCDLRDLTIYMNELTSIAKKQNIDYKAILKKLIPMASDKVNMFMVSTKEFLKSYVTGIGIGDIRLRRDC